ncbi:hypothetical protein NUW58_g169 [Xylaria curta]|uniref:Uncharacterized protein n=1 Tax=Xylaria curta TaxID=42375 RepID=A0ACC1PQ66_9PEZI|nr:hypothetical protein NUW58_g169 [Xylaria curta]
MTSPHPPAPESAFLTIPLEVRRQIYSFCIPQHLIFDCSDDMYYQNRPLGWTAPPWHLNEKCDRYASSEQNLIGEPRCIQKEWSLDTLMPPEEIEDVSVASPSVEEDLWDDGVEEEFGDFELGVHHAPSSSNRSALPALLLVCRQITDEVETMLYQGNTFTIDIDYQDQYHIERQFIQRSRKTMRDIILILRPISAPYQVASIMDPEIWDPVLSNLVTLGVIVEQPGEKILEWLDDDDEREVSKDFPTFLQDRKRKEVGRWTTWLLPIFEYLVQTVPKETEIVVDVAKEGDTVQALEYFQKGPFRFQRLPVADSICFSGNSVSGRLEFAWESESGGSWSQNHDDGPTSCRDIISSCDYEYYYSD